MTHMEMYKHALNTIIDQYLTAWYREDTSKIHQSSSFQTCKVDIHKLGYSCCVN